MTHPSIEGPSWDLSAEYSDVDDPQIEDDLSRASEQMDQMREINQRFGAGNVQDAQDLYRLRDQAGTLLSNVSVFARCLLSVDGNHAGARGLIGRLAQFTKRHAVVSEPLAQFLDSADEDAVSEFLMADDLAASDFELTHSRARRHTSLGLDKEQLIQGLAQDGLHAWNQLYGQISGTLVCPVEVDGEERSMGLAEASSLLLSGDEQQRKRAWLGVNAGWSVHEEACAAVINAISGWRLEMCAQRSGEKTEHYLDKPVHMSRIGRETLDTLMDVTERYRPLAQRAAKLQARAYGKTHFAPWDVRAPAPSISAEPVAPIPYAIALSQIADAYAEVDESMGDFVRMMDGKRWIEGTVGPNKRPGAYCTGFRKSKTPRVYMTYSGGASNVITLAHELGHAYHSWVMRDLPESQKSYGMSLAETASTFGETLVRDALLRQSTSLQARLDMVWAEMRAMTSFMLNIPARFSFERDLCERRSARPFRPDELKQMMSAAWRTWYGDALSEPDPMFWASKLHFHMSYISFYNFPYLFGYLFSLGVYARRATFGDTFFERYVALLRDTGRMSAEEIAQRHLGVDLTKPDFWAETIESLGERVDLFESILDEAGL